MAPTIVSAVAQKPVDLTVIVPTYNRLAMLKEALSSILSQSFDGNIEIIVIDDNSKDQTCDFVRQSHPDICLIALSENRGAYGARNQGLKVSRGKYIAFLDSDDIWEPDYVKDQMQVLKNQEKIFCVSALVRWDTTSNTKTVLSQRPNFQKHTSIFHHLLLDGSFILSPSSVVLPKRAFDEVGFFDETIRLGGDNEFYTRCLLSGYHPVFTEKPDAIQRKHSSGQATDLKNLKERLNSRLKILEKHYASIRSCTDIQAIQTMRAEIYASFASYYCVNKHFKDWIDLSLMSASQQSIQRVLLNMIRDINNLLSYHIPFLEYR